MKAVPLIKNKHNERLCHMYNNYAKPFSQLYKNPSETKISIYNKIYKDTVKERDGNPILCAGNCQTFSVYYIMKNVGAYFLVHITKRGKEAICLI